MIVLSGNKCACCGSPMRQVLIEDKNGERRGILECKQCKESECSCQGRKQVLHS